METIEALLPCDKCGTQTEVPHLRRTTGGRVFCRACMPHLFPALKYCHGCGDMFYLTDGAFAADERFRCSPCDDKHRQKALADIVAAEQRAAENVEKFKAAEAKQRAEAQARVELELRRQAVAIFEAPQQRQVNLANTWQCAGCEKDFEGPAAPLCKTCLSLASKCMTGSECEICARSPAIQVEFHCSIGMVIAMRQEKYNRRLCKRCGHKLFSGVMKRHALTTWWSPTALILGSWTSAGANVIERARLAALPEPQYLQPAK